MASWGPDLCTCSKHRRCAYCLNVWFYNQPVMGSKLALDDTPPDTAHRDPLAAASAGVSSSASDAQDGAPGARPAGSWRSLLAAPRSTSWGRW